MTTSEVLREVGRILYERYSYWEPEPVTDAQVCSMVSEVLEMVATRLEDASTSSANWLDRSVENP